MQKYYKVKKDTFLWEEGAIISWEENQNGYRPIEDIWNVTEESNEYISKKIIENPNNKDWFERVYPDTFKGSIYRTADQLKNKLKFRS